MQIITVNFDTSSIFRDYIYVDRGTKSKECECSIDNMIPVYPANVDFTQRDTRICANCGNQVRDIVNNLYNKVHGYSGYDEENDNE